MPEQSKVVIVYPWEATGEPLGTVRVEVYSPAGDRDFCIGSDVAPDLIPAGQLWGQDNLLPNSETGVEVACLAAHPTARDFKWHSRVCTAFLPEVASARAEIEVARSAYMALLEKYGALTRIAIVNPRRPDPQETKEKFV